jgi:hypothetical protein
MLACLASGVYKGVVLRERGGTGELWLVVG